MEYFVTLQQKKEIKSCVIRHSALLVVLSTQKRDRAPS